MKKALIIIGVVVAILAILGFIFRDTVGFMLMLNAIKPEVTFQEDQHPAAPDYNNPDHWASLPDKEDPRSPT